MKEEEFILTKSQEVLFEKLKKFLESPERIFLLIGKPGVGKTTMTKIVLKDYIEKDIQYKNSGPNIQVAGIALSHQAKNVLGEHIPNVFTFASAYGMKEVIYDDGSRSFEYDKYNKEPPIGEFPLPVFVHDEVSQYTQEMLHTVLDTTPMFSKIILMGDKGQLPPIDSKNTMEIDSDSPVFDIELSDDCKHELTERVRQSENNPILDLSDLIRDEIFGNQDITKVLRKISKPKTVDGYGYDFIAYKDLNEHIKNKDQLNTCVIAFRNKTVEYFNNQIRNHLLNNPKKRIIKGDIICMLDNYYHEAGSGVILYILHNSDVFKLGKVYTKKVIYNNNNKAYRIECYIAKIEGHPNKELIVPTELGQVDYDMALKEMAELCNLRKLRWDKFWDFKKKFCNCTYGYSITAYKAQGSTYDSVYVDINDILLTRPLTPKRKLQTIYTAITRARFNVHFLKART